MTDSMTSPKLGYRYSQNGFSIVEFMVAISLGLLIVGAVIGIFISGNRNYAQDERYARVQENARFAMKMLTTDIAIADFWGGITDPGSITSTLANTCGIALNARNAFVTYTDATDAATAVAGIDGTGCVTNAKANTSVFVVKRVQGACLANSADPVFSLTCATTAPENGKVYLRTTGDTGNLFIGDGTTVTPSGSRSWEYIPRIYYIRNFAVTASDGIPTLMRKDLASANAPISLVEGIEDFRIDVGVSADREQALPMKVHVLARSLDRDITYDSNRAGTKTYQMGNVCLNTAGDNGCIALATVDNVPQQYYRRVFGTTVAVRNPGLLAQFQ